MKSIVPAIAVIVFISCNESATTDTGKSDTAATDTTQMHIQIPASACYRYATASDTIALKVERFPNVVTGMLNYKLKEKDKNSGEIDGVLRGDTLIADYSFLSEGTRSTRQVAFLIQGDYATEGYGSMKDENGKMVFDNISTIDFSKGTKLVKLECNY